MQEILLWFIFIHLTAILHPLQGCKMALFAGFCKLFTRCFLRLNTG